MIQEAHFPSQHQSYRGAPCVTGVGPSVVAGRLWVIRLAWLVPGPVGTRPCLMQRLLVGRAGSQGSRLWNLGRGQGSCWLICGWSWGPADLGVDSRHRSVKPGPGFVLSHWWTDLGSGIWLQGPGVPELVLNCSGVGPFPNTAGCAVQGVLKLCWPAGGWCQGPASPGLVLA